MPRRDAAGLLWNERAGRYQRRAGGPFLSRQQVADALHTATENAGRRMQALTDRLRDRQISLAEWQTGMRLGLRDVHAYSAAIPQGGLSQMTPQAWGAVGRELRDQYERLNALAASIESGATPVDGRLRARVRLYGLSGRVSFEAAALRDLEARGFDEERNVRRAGDTCPGCLDASAAGWQPIGVITPPGTRDCLGNCRCFLRRRNSATGEVAA